MSASAQFAPPYLISIRWAWFFCSGIYPHNPPRNGLSVLLPLAPSIRTSPRLQDRTYLLYLITVPVTVTAIGLIRVARTLARTSLSLWYRYPTVPYNPINVEGGRNNKTGYHTIPYNIVATHNLTARSSTPTFESPVEPCQLSPVCTLFDSYMLIKPRLRDKNV